MTQNYCIVPTKSALYALQQHEEGECVYCEEDNKIYAWHENDWQLVDVENKGLSMNLYELNKTIVNQLPPMSVSDIDAKIKLFESLSEEHNNIHYMLLCKEYNYYTIFEYSPMTTIPTLGVAVCDIITNLGEVYSIEPTEDQNAIEIWIKPNGEESALAFYLFAYDAGVIYYG